MTYILNGPLEVHSEPCQTSKMELFVKIVNSFQPLEEVKRIMGSKLVVNK